MEKDIFPVEKCDLSYTTMDDFSCKYKLYLLKNNILYLFHFHELLSW